MTIHEERAYPYSREMMLNAIYDTLERLDILPLSINSEQGIVWFEAKNSFGGILHVETVYPAMTSTVSLEIESNEDGIVSVLFDEINSTIALSSMS